MDTYKINFLFLFQSRKVYVHPARVQCLYSSSPKSEVASMMTAESVLDLGRYLLRILLQDNQPQRDGGGAYAADGRIVDDPQRNG